MAQTIGQDKNITFGDVRPAELILTFADELAVQRGGRRLPRSIRANADVGSETTPVLRGCAPAAARVLFEAGHRFEFWSRPRPLSKRCRHDGTSVTIFGCSATPMAVFGRLRESRAN
jgi:hypothetical protein